MTTKDIRRATRKYHSADDKICVVLEGLCGKYSIAAVKGLLRTYTISWSKEFLETGKKRLTGDTASTASSDEMKSLRKVTRDLKAALADLTLVNRLLEKSMIGLGGRRGVGTPHIRAVAGVEPYSRGYPGWHQNHGAG